MSDPGPDDPEHRPSDVGHDPEADEALLALQRAARQMVTAARGLLDAAEVALDDPTLLRDAMGALGGLARDAVRMAADVGRQSAGDPGAGGATGPDDGDEGPVQHIPVD